MLVRGAKHLDAPNEHLAGRVRPLCPGVSIGHPHGSVGTLGGFVDIDADEGRQGILSTATVLWPRTAKIGDYIHQPGPIDNPLFTGDTRVAIAEGAALSRRRRNGMDAAYTLLRESIETTGNMIPDGMPDAGTVIAAPGAALAEGCRVAKIGRGTGYTTGRVTACGTSVMLHGVEHDRLWQTAEPEVLDTIEIDGESGAFSGPGDSGAVVFRLSDFTAVGLLFGSSEIDGRSYAHDIGRVLGVLGLRWRA